MPEETAIEETSAEETSTEEQVDWQARAEQAEASNTKLVNENKSLSGRAKAERTDELISMVREGADETAALSKMVHAFAVRTAKGETEEIAGDLVKLSSEAEQARQVTQYENGYDQIEASLFDAFRETDEDGEPIPGGAIVVDVDSPEVKALTDKWTASKGKRDLLALVKIVNDAHKLVKRLNREKATVSTEIAREEEKSTAKAEKAKAGVNNLSIPGPAAGSGTGKSWDQILKTTNPNDTSDADYFKAVAES